MSRTPTTASGQSFVAMPRSAFVVADMRSWITTVETEAAERVLGELEAYATGHGSLKAGRGNVDDILGFIAWFRGLMADGSGGRQGR